MSRRKFLILGASVGSLGAWSSAWSQAWPQRPIKLIVPFIPGSAPDVIARGLSERLSTALG